MRISAQKIVLALLVVFSLSACNQKKSGGSGRLNPGQAGPLNTAQCSSADQAIGRVFESSVAGSNVPFEQRVKGLLAATVNPQYFGTISGNGQSAQNGVTLEGRLQYNPQSGAVVLEQTNLRLTIYDSFVGQADEGGSPIQPYVINFETATSGTVNVATNQFTLQFGDQYGSVSVTGQMAGTTVTGTISYQNTTNFDGSAGYGGTLGDFSISTCGWLY